MSEEKNKVTMALIGVQNSVLKVLKDGKNPVFNSRYATLSAILDMIREPLATHGFGLIQDATTDPEAGTVSVTTRLLHESGEVLESKPLSAKLRTEFLKSGVEVPASVQQIGAQVTYLRRYSLCAFLAVSFDEDDDGNMASGKTTGDAPQTQKPPTPRGNQKSIYTGEALDTPEAIARHKAAGAAKTAELQAARDNPSPTPKTPQNAAETAAKAGTTKATTTTAPTLPEPPTINAKLDAAITAAQIMPHDLAGYLHGASGKPRISRPILVGNMGLDTLGDEIVAALLQPENWNAVVQRIKADEENFMPF